MKDKKILLKFTNYYQIVIWALLSVASLLTIVFIITDVDKPSDYTFLFLLPLAFFTLSVICSKVYTYLFDNIGVTLLVLLMFIRSVLNPLFMSFYGYEERVVSQGIGHMTEAVLLVVYEMICVFITILISMSVSNKTEICLPDNRFVKRKYTECVYRYLLIVALLLLVGCIVVAPQLLTGYRSITQIGEADFASYEDTQLISEYATNTLLRFTLVTGNYLMRAMLAIVPGFLIVKLSSKRTRVRRLLAFCCCFIPLFFISGVIARSLIYVVCLLLLYFYMYSPNKVPKKTTNLIMLASGVVILWWGFNSGGKDGLQYISARLGSYFSGINNVCASLNLSGDISERFLYFVTDYVNSIPYGGTIFGSSHQTMSEFFNDTNGVRGQIPTTIGTSMFYFGPLLAPIYSCVFAHISVRAAKKIKGSIYTNPLQITRLILTAMYFAMGIIMYNISITLTNFFSILLPMYLMEKIAYKEE